jgi:putative acetyltransferase
MTRADEERIRPAVPEDHAGIDAVESAAFGARGQVVVALVHRLRRSEAVRSELVAEVGGRVVGHVLVSRGWIDATPRLVDVHVLSPLAVDVGWRGRGVATRLLERAVVDSAAVVPAVFLEGDPAF